MSDSSKSFVDKWGLAALNGFAILSFYAFSAYIGESIRKDLRCYVTVERYEREQEAVKLQLNETLSDRKLYSILSADIKVLNVQMKAVSDKLDEIYREVYTKLK